jgi:hypothetical protein
MERHGAHFIHAGKRPVSYLFAAEVVKKVADKRMTC